VVSIGPACPSLRVNTKVNRPARLTEGEWARPPRLPGIIPPAISLLCMETFYRIAADTTVTLHMVYVAFVVLGLGAVLVGHNRRWEWVRNRWFRVMHLAMILIVVVETWAGVECPLTTLEQALRERAGETTYSGSFVANAMHDLLFFDLPEWCFTLIYTAFGTLVVSTLFLVPIGRSVKTAEPASESECPNSVTPESAADS
jgi:Protein of Unknown function (DUF2784)